jgi:hypothetical protein
MLASTESSLDGGQAQLCSRSYSLAHKGFYSFTAAECGFSVGRAG